MGHMMLSLKWLSPINSSTRSLLEAKIQEKAYEESKKDVTVFFEKLSDELGYARFYKFKIPERTVEFKLFNYMIILKIVYDKLH
jgi:hypothetical protein